MHDVRTNVLNCITFGRDLPIFVGPNGRFVAAELEDGAVFRSAVLSGFWLRLEWLWMRPLPNSQLVTAEILMSVESLPEAVRSAYSALYQALQARAG